MPLWDIGLIMALGGFIGARLGAKVVISKGKKLIRPLVVIVSNEFGIEAAGATAPRLVCILIPATSN